MVSSERRPIGRPRGFDVDEALERAMLLFWELGYEGASLARLTQAMGISTTSMYATFGNKEELFVKAMRRYTDGPGGYAARALEKSTAMAVVTAFLDGAVRTTTDRSHPLGCLSVHGALATSDAGREVRDLLADIRQDTYRTMRDRLQRAVDDGELPPGTDAELMARRVVTLAAGIAVQAATGVDRAELQAVVDAFLKECPAI